MKQAILLLCLTLPAAGEPVPAVVGMTASVARAQLAQAGYRRVHEIHVAAPDQAGKILAQRPPAGESTEPEELISLYVGVQPRPKAAPAHVDAPKPPAPQRGWLYFLVFQPVLAGGLYLMHRGLRCLG